MKDPLLMSNREYDCPPEWEAGDAQEAAEERLRMDLAEEYAQYGYIKIGDVKLDNSDVSLAASELNAGMKEGLERVLDDAFEMTKKQLGWD